MTTEEIFAKAIELPADQQSAFLDDAFHERPQDRAQMEAMLAAHQQSDSLLDIADQDSTESHVPAIPESLEQIGNYKLLQKIGEGGMGSVYMAEQLRPVKRIVAFKVVKAGLDSKQVIARFEAERQSLAMMDHPNIAKVLDAGATVRGEPYFVMELVKGLPVTEYCDTNRLSTEQRVKLMVDICGAVQHAHQKGIIHRDLKPSNILVAQYDDRPVPKVIDFGVAKATHQKLTEKTLYTQLGQIVGTLEYMSPEQAVLNQLDVDTRTDVYSLGVVLYELLVGNTPLDGKKLRSQGLDQILLAIREQEPARPSLRLSSQGQAAAQTAAYRHTDQSTLSRALRGDLDWVVMKALEKDRRRRYDSASRLAEDLNCYLSGDVVDARPPSTSYRLQKFWGQHKQLAASACAILVVLSVAFVFSYWQWTVVAQQRDLAEMHLAEKEEAIAKWHFALIERGLESAFRGDLQTTQEIVAEARDAEAPKEWIFLIEALAFQFSGEMGLATQRLSQAFEANPNSLAIASALVMSRVGNTGMFVNLDSEDEVAEGVVSLLGRLGQLKPSEEYGQYDLILRGWSQVYEDPTAAVATLDGVLKPRQRPWPFGQAVFAMAVTSEALDTGDTRQAMQAVNMIREVESQLQDNPFVMFIGVLCRCTALMFPDRNTDINEITAEGRRLVEKLERYPNGWASSEIRAGFLEIVEGSSNNTRDAYKTIRNDWWFASRAAVLMRGGHLQEFLDSTGKEFDGFPLRAIGEASAHALTGDSLHAMTTYERVSGLPSWPVRLNSLEIPLLLKDTALTQRDARQLLKQVSNEGKDFFDPPFWIFELRLRYLSREIDETEFLQRIGGSNYGKCYANYLIGLTYRAQGLTECRRYFEDCLAGQFWMPQYQFAKTILEREFSESAK